MKDKNEVSQLVKDFYDMVQMQFKTRVKTIRSDNGREFVSGSMKMFYREQGIIHKTTCVDTPQQNRRVERKHWHVLNAARALVTFHIGSWGERTTPYERGETSTHRGAF